MYYETFIGLRYLRAKRKQTMISIVSGIAVLGVALGVFALITVIAVMTGFQKDLRDKILGASSHLVAVGLPGHHGDEQELIEIALSDPEIVAAAPFVYSKVLISFENRADGILVKGIDPERVGDVTDLERNMTEGKLANLGRLKDEQEPGIILGAELAGNLQVDVGEKVKILLPEAVAGPAGTVPRLRRFEVVGIFNAGMFEYDAGMAYIDIGLARDLFRDGNGVAGVEMKVRDIFSAMQVGKRLQAKVGFKYNVRDWSQMNATFFSALKLEKIAMFLILVLIILVAAFNIIGTLTMMVMEKSKDIGILKAMGAKAKNIMALFLVQGMAIGLTGTLLGGALGIITCYLGDHYKLIRLQGDVYYLSYLPFRVELADILLICGCSLLISLLATLYPAWQAARMDPVEAIRYE